MNHEEQSWRRWCSEEMARVGPDAFRAASLGSLQLRTVVKESHGSAIRWIAYNQTSRRLGNLVATVGGTQASVYDDEFLDGRLSLVCRFDNVSTAHTPGGQLLAATWFAASPAGGPELLGPLDALPHPGDALLAVGGTDCLVSVISVAASRVLMVLRGHRAAIVDLAAPSAGGRRSGALASLDATGEVRLWAALGGACLGTVFLPGALSLAISPLADDLVVMGGGWGEAGERQGGVAPGGREGPRFAGGTVARVPITWGGGDDAAEDEPRVCSSAALDGLEVPPPDGCAPTQRLARGLLREPELSTLRATPGGPAGRGGGQTPPPRIVRATFLGPSSALMAAESGELGVWEWPIQDGAAPAVRWATRMAPAPAVGGAGGEGSGDGGEDGGGASAPPPSAHLAAPPPRLASTPDGAYVAVPGPEGEGIVVRTSDGAEVARLPPPRALGPAAAAAVSTGCSTLLVAAGNGFLFRHEAPRGTGAKGTEGGQPLFDAATVEGKLELLECGP